MGVVQNVANSVPRLFFAQEGRVCERASRLASEVKRGVRPKLALSDWQTQVLCVRASEPLVADLYARVIAGSGGADVQRCAAEATDATAAAVAMQLHEWLPLRDFLAQLAATFPFEDTPVFSATSSSASICRDLGHAINAVLKRKVDTYHERDFTAEFRQAQYRICGVDPHAGTLTVDVHIHPPPLGSRETDFYRFLDWVYRIHTMRISAVSTADPSLRFEHLQWTYNKRSFLS